MILVKSFNDLGNFLEKSKKLDNYQITISSGFQVYEITASVYNYYLSLNGIFEFDNIYLDIDSLKYFIKKCFRNLGFFVSVNSLCFDFSKIDGTLVFSFGIENFSVVGVEENE